MTDKKKPDDDPLQSALIREVDEELRQDQMQALWKTYGTYLVGAAVAIVLVVAGYKGWQSWETNARIDKTDQFAEALRLGTEGKDDEARRVLSDLIEQGGGHGLLARFQDAALTAKAGDPMGAAAALRAVADDGGIAQEYRDLALVMSVLHELDVTDAETLRGRLAPVAAGDSPWRHSVREIEGVLAYRAGDKAKAAEIFGALADDKDTPPGIRARAEELKAALSGQG